MESIPARARDALAEVGIAVAYVFGSRARGEDTADSDVDIAVLCERDLDLWARAGLANALADAFGVERVDVIVLEEAPLELRGRVVQEGRLIHSRDEPRRVAWETRTRSEWFDFRPTLQTLTNTYLRRVARHGL